MHLVALILLLLLAWLWSRHQRRVARRRGVRVVRRRLGLREGVLMGVISGALKRR
jgi:hypothetical protein